MVRLSTEISGRRRTLAAAHCGKATAIASESANRGRALLQLPMIT
jgi:hypothetical protein